MNVIITLHSNKTQSVIKANTNQFAIPISDASAWYYFDILIRFSTLKLVTFIVVPIKVAHDCGLLVIQ